MKKLLILIQLVMAGGLFAQTGEVKGRLKLENDKCPVTFTIDQVKQATELSADHVFVIKGLESGTHILLIDAENCGHKQLTIEITSGKTTDLGVLVLDPDAELTEVEVIARREKKYVETEASTTLRLNTPLIETPQNITVVTSQTLKDFGINGTAEMARLTSGITKRYGNTNDFAFLIRGTEASNNVFRNGVGNYWYNQQSDAFMIDRVEFVKGPAGFMIGNAEPGGILNEVTKQADGKKVLEIEMAAGSFMLSRLGVDIGNRFTPESKFSYRLLFGGQYSQTFYDFANSYRMFVLPSLRYAYGKNSWIVAEMNYMNGLGRAENSSNISFDGKTGVLPRSFNSADLNVVKGLKSVDNYYRLAHQHSFNANWQWNTQLAKVWGIYRGSSMYVSGWTPAFDTLYREWGYTNWENSLETAQTFVSGKFDTGANFEHSILAGVDYGRTEVNSTWSTVNPDLYGTQFAISVANPQYNLTEDDVRDTTTYEPSIWGTTWAALYVQDHLKFRNFVILTLAGRYSYTESWASYDNNTVYNTKFTPRLGLTFMLSEKMSVYALYDEAFLPQTGRKKDNTSARPLTGENIELGYKALFRKDKLSINASLYRTVKNNVLVQDPLTDMYEERGQITSQGIEFSATGNLSKNVIVNVNYTYTDARVTKDADPVIVGFKNYGTAEHAANGMVRYKFTDGKLKGFSFGLGAQYMGERCAVYASYTDPVDKNRTSPAYLIFDANAGYELKKFTFGLNVYNLLNARYIDNAYFNSSYDAAVPGFYTYSNSAPINFRLSVNYKLF